MKTIRTGGFTLIELLTVIAIIAILAAMSMTVGPRILEKGKLAAYSNTCNQIRTAAVAYFTKYKESYPPSYGYIDKSYLTNPNSEDIPRIYRPYMAYLELFRNFGVYDRFAMESGDTDRDGVLSLLEFSPVGRPEGPIKYEFEREIYSGSNLPNEVAQQLKTQRPIVYIAVNLKQAQKVAEYYYQVAQSQPLVGWNARAWDPSAAPISGLTFPPTKYDDFVLISPGPSGSTAGILTPPGDPFMGVLQASGVPIEDWYHILGLRAYFLATRDANENGLWDFDYRNRTRQGGEGKPSSYETADLNLLPDGTNGAGPIIYAPNNMGVSQ